MAGESGLVSGAERCSGTHVPGKTFTMGAGIPVLLKSLFLQPGSLSGTKRPSEKKMFKKPLREGERSHNEIILHLRFRKLHCLYSTE